jgi:ArsR family transcriptional regulator
MDTHTTHRTSASLPDTAEHTACCDGQAVPETPSGLQHVDALADRLKALADPTRLRMLELLAHQSAPLCVCEINEHFAQRQPTISHHLRILREAGLIDCEKRGVWAYYWATATGSEWLSTVRGLR